MCPLRGGEDAIPGRDLRGVGLVLKEPDAGVSPPVVPPLDLATVAAAAVLVYSLALVAHEVAHALAGWSAGGTPTLISSTDTRGDWSELGAPGVVWTAVSGTVANVLLALVGWLGFRRGVGSPGPWTAVFWLTFAVNAWMPSAYLAASPLFGFGDWSTLVAVFPNQGPLRASLTVTGLFVCGLLWQRTRPSLARLLGGGERNARQQRGRVFARTAWLAGGAIALAASLLSPLDVGRAVPIAVGSTLGTTWPILAAAQRIGEHPVPGAPLRVTRVPELLALGLAAGLVLVLVFGPGVRLWRRKPRPSGVGAGDARQTSCGWRLVPTAEGL